MSKLYRHPGPFPYDITTYYMQVRNSTPFDPHIFFFLVTKVPDFWTEVREELFNDRNEDANI